MRTLPITGALPQPRALTALGLVVVGLLVLVCPALGAADARAQTAPSTQPANFAPSVSVVSVSGYIDPVLAALMTRAVDDANSANAIALVFQVDLQGAVIPEPQLIALVKKMANSKVPVDIWIGPTGSELNGAATALIFGAKKIAMAPGAHIGNLPPHLDAGSLRSVISQLPQGAKESSFLGNVRTDIAGSALYDQSLDAKAAGDAKIAEFAPTLLLFFVGLPGVETKEVTANGQTHREPVTNVVFSQLSLVDNFMHTVASPAVAYLLFAVGLSLFIFELFTAGVGVGGVIGAGSFVLACYGLAGLPTHSWAIVLILAGMVAFAVDVQTGVPRLWTGVGMAFFVLGSLTLYDGVSMSWLTIGVGIVGVALSFLAGMPPMVRTRFSTPTIGREWMVGRSGRAASDINPDGVVQIEGAPWRAYTNRATPIEQLEMIRVVGIEGLVLEVEPEDGAARDYRNREAKQERS